MILRRVIAHFRKQEWTAIALDFLIVVVGVFVGLQVNNWNAAQNDEQAGRGYIIRIQEDLKANQSDTLIRMEYYRWVKGHAIIALTAHDRPSDELGEQFIISSYFASRVLPRPLGRDTYDELLSVGAINMIPNLMVRQRLAGYYRGAEATETYLRYVPPYRQALLRSLLYEAQSALRTEASCSDTFSTDETGAPVTVAPTSCALGLTPAQTSETVANILDADLEPELRHLLADSDSKLSLFQLVIDRSQELYDYLETTK